MFMKTKILFKGLFRVFFILIFVSELLGCQKVINVDLNDAAPLIVIEGIITDSPGPYLIQISKSGSFFNQPVLPPVPGADVTISDSRGIIDTLEEIKPGIYRTSKTHGIPGNTYTLKVISDNKEYIGSSTMYSHVRIDSLTVDKSQFQHMGLGGGNKDANRVELICHFKDPFEKNFYRLKVIGKDSTLDENYRLYDDQYTNGQEIAMRAAHVMPGDTVRIELFSLDQQTFSYYRSLEDLINTNPFFGSTPANPNTNLSNGALGYFGACAVSSKTVIIIDSLLQ
jgi:hypothetical protein